MINSFIVCCFLIFVTSCTEKPDQKTIRLGINPWPGYEFLYLADQKGFFEEEDLDIELVELASLADIKRVFEQGRIDAMASTIIEAVEVSLTSNQKISIALIPDFSNGGDVILANSPIASIADLKGKKVGVELGLLGSFILSQALEKNGLSLDDVTMLNVEQLDSKNQLMSGNIAAMVTYPPFSTETLRHGTVNQIFSTADIPGDVIDVISIKGNSLIHPREWQQKLFTVWQRALDYAKNNPEDANKIMSEREGISAEEFVDALTGMEIIKKDKQTDLLNSEQLANNILRVCRALNQVNAENHHCDTINDRISPLNH